MEDHDATDILAHGDVQVDRSSGSLLLLAFRAGLVSCLATGFVLGSIELGVVVACCSLHP